MTQRARVRVAVLVATMLVVSACGGSKGGPAGPSSSSRTTQTEPINFDILSERLVQRSSFPFCLIQVTVRNRTDKLIMVGVGYIAYDAGGNQIGVSFGGPGGFVNGGATATLEGYFVGGNGVDFIRSCSTIARFERVAVSG